MEMDWDRPWLMLEKMRMRMTPRTIMIVPFMSVGVTAGHSVSIRYDKARWDLRVPTSHRAKRKLKTRDEDPRGATQSGRRYLRASGEPTGSLGQVGFVKRQAVLTDLRSSKHNI